MTRLLTFSLPGIMLAAGLQTAVAQHAMQVPAIVEAGKAFSILTTGSGKATLYMVGTGNALKRTLQLGDTVTLAAADTANAGHYMALLAWDSTTEKAEFDIVTTQQPANLSFLAKPSRLPVDQSSGISGVVYVFDAHRNLILVPTQVYFQLADAPSRTVTTQNGVAWIRINSAAKAGPVQFEATSGAASEKRIVQQVPGEACALKMNAHRSAGRIALETEPVRDCRGNALPDGTVVTFTEMRDGRPAASVDAPLKHDVAKTELPAYRGAVVSVALGVSMGNEIRVGAQP